jgi:hypothetical protein
MQAIAFDNSEIDLVQGVINVEGVMGLNRERYVLLIACQDKQEAQNIKMIMYYFVLRYRRWFFCIDKFKIKLRCQLRIHVHVLLTTSRLYLVLFLRTTFYTIIWWIVIILWSNVCFSIYLSCGLWNNLGLTKCR